MPDKEKKKMPSNISAEKTVLGSMLLEEACLLDAVDTLTDDDFYLAAHKLIFKAIIKLFSQDISVDAITLTDCLLKNEQIEQVGGAVYISDLADSVPTTANFQHYLNIVLNLARRRKIIKVVKKAYIDGFNLKNENYIEETEQAIFEAASFEKKPIFSTIAEILKQTVNELQNLIKKEEKVTGIATGLDSLDNLTCGFHPGQFVVIGARPSIGKTALALNIAEHIATSQNKKHAVAFFSLEMPARDLVKRILSAHALIDGQHFRNGKLTKPELASLGKSLTFLKDAPFYIDQTSSLSPIELRARVRRLIARVPNLKIVFIDYIQLMRANARTDSRADAVAQISRAMKALAMELNIVVVALSQLNRESEKGVGKNSIPPPPRLAQLKESGAIEQDADVVILLHRPGFYSNDPKYAGKCSLNIEKQRNGPVDSFDVAFASKFSKFSNL